MTKRKNGDAEFILNHPLFEEVLGKYGTLEQKAFEQAISPAADNEKRLACALKIRAIRDLRAELHRLAKGDEDSGDQSPASV